MATAVVTPDQDCVIAEVFIAAPPARVFEAITDPNQVPKWWGQQGLYRILDWKADLRPGGKWLSSGQGADGTAFTVQGEYIEVVPPRLLVHTWVPSYAGNYKTVVRWELEPAEVHGLHPSGPRKAGTGTKVVIRHTGFVGAPPAMCASHADGWKRVMGWIKVYLEENKSVEVR